MECQVNVSWPQKRPTTNQWQQESSHHWSRAKQAGHWYDSTARVQTGWRWHVEAGNLHVLLAGPHREPWLYNVCFAVRNSLLHMDMPPNGGYECHLSHCLSTSSGKLNILSVYTPTLCSAQETKDKVDEEESENIILLIDFNVRVGSDRISWPDCFEHFTVGRMNINGQWLVKLCSYHKLCIIVHFFPN